MTFFNKKTEVMKIEMTPYGRYLYSIGKFKPHSYEFVDDDVVYKVDGETQESAHNRIINETLKQKPNRNFQVKEYKVLENEQVETKRETVHLMNQKISSERALGRSSYSSDKTPSFEVTALVGEIQTSDVTKNLDGTGSSIFIPQIDIDYKIFLTKRNELDEPQTGYEISTQVYDGEYLEINYLNKLLLIKEANSFYEKENFEFEVFHDDGPGGLIPLKMRPQANIIKNGMLEDEVQDQDPQDTLVNSLASLNEKNYIADVKDVDESFMEYFFDIITDENISNDELCAHKHKIKVNNIFLDEEIICPDTRTDRFDLYASNVGPDDLEDCDDD